MKKLLIKIVIGKFLLLFVSSAYGAVKVSANVNKKIININETIDYSLNVKGAFKKLPRIIIPQFKNFIILSSQQNHSFNIKRGKFEVTIRYTLTLKPLRQGKFILPPFKVKALFKTYQTQKITVEVIGSRKKREKIIEEEGIWI